MLGALAPDSRTHRLAVLVAGMLQYAVGVAIEEEGLEPTRRGVAYDLLCATEAEGPEEVYELIGKLAEELFEDAGVPHARVNARGEDYSVIYDAGYQFLHWYDMPWEA